MYELMKNKTGATPWTVDAPAITPTGGHNEIFF